MVRYHTSTDRLSFFKTQHEDMSQLQVLTDYLAIMKVKILGYSMQLPRLGRLAAITAEVLKQMVPFHHVEIHLNALAFWNYYFPTILFSTVLEAEACQNGLVI